MPAGALSTGVARGRGRSGILLPVIDVLPAALSGAAAAVRSVAADLDPEAARRDTGCAQLDDAIARFLRAGAVSASSVAVTLVADAADLDVAGATYAEVESLLVPRSLR